MQATRYAEYYYGGATYEPLQPGQRYHVVGHNDGWCDADCPGFIDFGWLVFVRNDDRVYVFADDDGDEEEFDLEFWSVEAAINEKPTRWPTADERTAARAAGRCIP